MATPKPPSHVFRRHQVFTILGFWLIMLPTGLRWLWGNLTVYTSSYFYFKGGHNAQQVNTPWMLSIYMLAWATGVFVSGPLLKHAGRRFTHMLGILLFTAGIALSYISVRFNSIASLIMTIGCVSGWGNGIIETVSVLVVSEWAGKHQGFVISLIYGSSVLGAVFSNQFVTSYINPSNLKPHLRIGPSTFFTQLPILEKTPSFFLLLAIITIAVQGPAVVLISYHRKESEKKSTWRSKFCCYYKSSNILSEETCISSSPTDDLSVAESQDVQICQDTEDEEINMTPRQALRSLTFHALWFGFTSIEFSKVWLFNYYKIFGLNYIADDHFLTDLGTVMAVVATLSRSFWGWSLDHLGIKNTLTACSASATCVIAFYFFSPQINRWTYVLFTLVFGVVTNAYSMLVAVVMVRLYGKKHFSINYGLVSAPYIVINLMFPIVFQGFLDMWGWFPLLATMALFNGISAVIEILIIPNSGIKK